MDAPGLARTARLLADDTRAAMCLALLDGRAWTAGELARHAGVAASTATEHLHRLIEGRLLAQACAATTTLITRATALRADDPKASAEDLVARVLREDPPATATRRTAIAAVGEIAEGETVAVSLAGTPFGAGAHACPGSAVAITLACVALDMLADTP